MSLITMGLGHLTIITMGLGQSFRLQKSMGVLSPPQFGKVKFVNTTPEIEEIDEEVKITMSDSENTEAQYD